MRFPELLKVAPFYPISYVKNPIPVKMHGSLYVQLIKPRTPYVWGFFYAFFGLPKFTL
jgi:hypothetical protein